MSDLRWTIKPELLVSPLTGAEISMGIAYGPVLGESIEVLPVSDFDALVGARDERRDQAERQLDVMREAAARLRPLARRAVTEPGKSGDEARSELRGAIDWMAKGCPPIDDAEFLG